MSPDPLDDLLRDYARQPLPPVPDGLRSAVWREIGRRRERPGWLGLLWPNLRQRPGLAFAALALAVGGGVWPVAASRLAGEKAQLARASLHFEVFSPEASSVLAASIRPLAKAP
jgi:hypothetical protein